jgi:hypothetical protein
VVAVSDELRQQLGSLTRWQYAQVLQDFRWSPRSLAALDDLLDLCRQQQIPFALLLMPEAEPFRALYPAAGEYQLQGLLAQLQQSWHVPVIDARSWVPDEAFWDTHHLLPCGALLFSQRFEQDALSLVISH